MTNELKNAGHVEIQEAEKVENAVLFELRDIFTGDVLHSIRSEQSLPKIEGWCLRDLTGEPVLGPHVCTNGEPNENRLLQFILIALWQQIYETQELRKEVKNSDASMYADGIMDSVTAIESKLEKKLEEMSKELGRIASGTDSVDEGIRTLVDDGVKVRKAGK